MMRVETLINILQRYPHQIPIRIGVTVNGKHYTRNIDYAEYIPSDGDVTLWTEEEITI